MGKIDKILKLSCLTLNESEAQEFEKIFSEILIFFNDLKSLNTEGVKPLVTPIEIKVSLREDEASKWEKARLSLDQAPSIQGSLFKVPPVV